MYCGNYYILIPVCRLKIMCKLYVYIVLEHTRDITGPWLIEVYNYAQALFEY